MSVIPWYEIAWYIVLGLIGVVVMGYYYPVLETT